MTTTTCGSHHPEHETVHCARDPHHPDAAHQAGTYVWRDHLPHVTGSTVSLATRVAWLDYAMALHEDLATALAGAGFSLDERATATFKLRDHLRKKRDRLLGDLHEGAESP